MSRKFFSLIKGDGVHIAPNTKVVAADAFSTLMTIQETIDRVKADGDAYRQAVAKECETIKEQAYRDGFESGLSSWADQLAMLHSEVKGAREEISKVVIPLALKAAKKIVGREIEIDKDVIIDIVKNNLKGVAQHKQVTIYVNKKDLATLEKNRASFQNMLEAAEVLNLRERNDIQPGGCIIESEVGIINAQLDNQWLILEQAFESLIKAQRNGKNDVLQT